MERERANSVVGDRVQFIARGLGAFAVAAVAVLAAIPVALIGKVTGWGATIDRSKEEVITYIENFIAGEGGDWDWDDFTSVPIADPRLERVRQQCLDAPELWPPVQPGQYCNHEGLSELSKLADGLRRTDV